MQDIVTSTGLFIYDNIWGILVIVTIFLVITFYITLENIKFVEQKTKVSKVVVIEKMTDKFSVDKLKQDTTNALKNNDVCGKMNSKETCVALGTCVWTTTKDKKDTIQKCLEAESVHSSMIPGSKGPVDICYCSKNGKLVPWEKYYYQGKNGDKIVEKKAKKCLYVGEECQHK